MNNQNTLTIQHYIKTNEGLRLKPYKCTADKTTIGYGRNLDDKGIKEEEAEFMFLNDFNDTVLEAKKIINNYDNIKFYAQMVCVDMLFNLGLNKFMLFKNFIKAIEKQDYSSAADELKYTDTATKKELTPYWQQTKIRAIKNYNFLKGLA
jgi:lysozyme